MSLSSALQREALRAEEIRLKLDVVFAKFARLLLVFVSNLMKGLVGT